MKINSAKEQVVYQKAYQRAMKAFELSKTFPPEERHALTSQIRRASRSVCLNLREAWAKRRYEAHFVSKLTDCDGENAETDSCSDFAHDCGYINRVDHQLLAALSHEIRRLLGSMMLNPQKWTTGSSDL
ncbi:MAG TPA: four helix bundle protein [Verrucomicrobiae bacterium]|nr:four helix bundle protein [Verrucomicrobiae bacterium]